MTPELGRLETRIRTLEARIENLSAQLALSRSVIAQLRLPNQHIERIELQEDIGATAAGQANCNLVDKDGTSIKDDIIVYDFGVPSTVGGSGALGRAIWCEDAQRYEFLQLDCTEP